MAIVVGQTTWQRTAWAGSLSLGSDISGNGRAICKGGGIVWIVAPSSSQVSRTWDNRNDAVTTACACTTATTWFIPSCDQLYNPGFICRTYWDSYAAYPYWSSTSFNSTNAVLIVFSTTGCARSFDPKSASYCVRAFRCVTY